MTFDENECLITEVLDQFDYLFEPNLQSRILNVQEVSRISTNRCTIAAFNLLSSTGFRSCNLCQNTPSDHSIISTYSSFLNISKRQFADFMWLIASVAFTVTTIGSDVSDVLDPVWHCGPM